MGSFDYKTYYEDYWDQDEIQRGMDYYELRYNHIKHRITPNPKAAVLDVGGGNGQFLEFLGIRNATVLDISSSGLQQAKKRGYRIVKADVQKPYPIADNTFDMVLCFETIEHIDEPVAMLTNIKKCLKDGGTLVLGVPNLPADGVHHKKRWYLRDTIGALRSAGFSVSEILYTPAFIEKETFDGIRRLKSIKKGVIHMAAYGLSLLPFSAKHSLAKAVPDRFAMLFIVKATK